MYINELSKSWFESSCSHYVFMYMNISYVYLYIKILTRTGEDLEDLSIDDLLKSNYS